MVGAPIPPDALVEACLAGRLVLFTGAGFAAQSGLPTWRELLVRILSHLSELDPEYDWRSMVRRLEDGESGAVIAEFIATTTHPAHLQAAIEKEAALVPYEGTLQRPLMEPLRLIRPAGVLTTNWSQTDHRLWGDRRDKLEQVTPDSGRFGEILRSNTPFEVFLFGSFALKGSVRFSQAEYSQDLFANPQFHRFIVDLLSTRTVLFLGAGFETISDFVESARLRTRPESEHFALIPMGAASELELDLLQRRSGIHALEFGPTPGFPELELFVSKLAALVKEARGDGGRAPAAPQAESLEHVHLRNIGPFEELDIDIGPEWTVLLGDNGCGKSTVLRAIALALSAEDARVAGGAKSLLRAGARSGLIELVIGGQTWRVDLVREAERRVRVAPERTTPLEAGRWLVLGFPPLRGPAGRNPSGASAAEAREPDVDDVLPLILEQVDGRLEGLKQWIVNMQVRADRGSRGAAGIRDAFFEIANELVPGVGFTFSRLDEATWDILLRVAGGEGSSDTNTIEIPLDRISQGMSSTLAWVGTLLQRLYDLYPDDEAPATREALVLVDELDAHLHPSWQLAIVPALRKRFPRVQFVATTHSALVVLNTKDGEVVQLRREGGRVDAIPITRSFTGLRADQALLGPGFELHSARDKATTELYDEYLALLSQADRDKGTEKRIRDLASMLDQVLVSPGETEQARKGRRLVEQTMASQLAEMTEAERRNVLAEVERYYLQIKSDG